MNFLRLLPSNYNHLLQVFVAFVVVLVVIYLSLHLFKRQITLHYPKSQSFWAVNRIFKPLLIGACSYFIFFVSFSFLKPFIEYELRATFFLIGSQSLIFCFSTWFLFSIRKETHRLMASNLSPSVSNLSYHQIDLFDKISLTLILSVALFQLLNAGGISMSTLLAVASACGISIGFAAKDVMSNFFSGIMIYLTQPFKIGEAICINERNVCGIVEEIGFYLTQIRGFDSRPQYIPNALFYNFVITNMTRMQARRVNLSLSIRLKDIRHIRAINDAILNDLRNNTNIRQDMSLIAAFQNVVEHRAEILVFCFVNTIEWETWLAYQQEILIRCEQIIKSHDAELTLPTQHLQFDASTPTKTHAAASASLNQSSSAFL